MKFVSFLNLLLLSALSTSTFADTFTLSSQDMANQSPIPVLYTCDNKNISPPLIWLDAPSQTKSFTLILSDPDASNGTFYHWILYHLPKTVMSLAPNVINYPSGTLIGKNSAGVTAYSGPCPPQKSEHHYIFTLYALDTQLELTAGANGNEVLEAMKDHILAKAELSTTYSR